jgi:osmotically-inducible protein OsmY
MTSPIKTLLTIAAIGLASACSHDEEGTSRAERRADTAGDEARADANRADDEVERTAEAADREADEATDGDDDGELTAADQSNSDGDIAITQAIRSAVTRDDSLSMSARNVAIITVDSVVTLRGSVNSADERSTVERHASEVEGVARIDNQLVVD